MIKVHYMKGKQRIRVLCGYRIFNCIGGLYSSTHRKNVTCKRCLKLLKR